MNIIVRNKFGLRATSKQFGYRLFTTITKHEMHVYNDQGCPLINLLNKHTLVHKQ